MLLGPNFNCMTWSPLKGGRSRGRRAQLLHRGGGLEVRSADIPEALSLRLPLHVERGSLSTIERSVRIPSSRLPRGGVSGMRARGEPPGQTKENLYLPSSREMPCCSPRGREEAQPERRRSRLFLGTRNPSWMTEVFTAAGPERDLLHHVGGWVLRCPPPCPPGVREITPKPKR